MGLLDFLSNLGGGTQGAGDPNGGILAGIGGFARNNSNALTGLGTGLLSGPNWTTGMAAAGPAFQQGHQEDLRNQIFQNSMRANAAVINNMNIDPTLKAAALANPQISQSIISQQFAPKEYKYEAMPDGTLVRTDIHGGGVAPVYQSAVKNDIVPIPGTNQIASVNPYGTSPSTNVTPPGIPTNGTPLTPEERALWKIDPNTPAYKNAMGQPVILGPQSQVNINNNQRSKLSEVSGDIQGQTYGALWKDGMQATTDLAKVNLLADQMSKLPGGLIGNAQRVANNFGIKIGKDAGAVESANAIIQGLIPNQRQGMPGAVSDADREMFAGALPKLGNTPQGNAIILGTMRNLAQRRVALGRIGGAVMNNQMTPEDADKAIQALPDPFADLRTAVQGQTQVGNSPYAEGTRLTGPNGTYVVKNGQPVLEQ